MTDAAVTRASALKSARRLEGVNLVNGKLVGPSGKELFELYDPATRELIVRVANSGTADVDEAVAAAKRAQREWAQVPARARGKLLVEAASVLGRHSEELAGLLALESGKALRTECRVEAANVVDALQFFGGLAGEIKGETVPFAPGVLSYTQREPVGVVAAILPWNVPLMLMAIKIAPALVAGNCVVVKSAEETPLTVLRAAELLSAELPPGVLNVLSGDGPRCGAPLVAHPDVAKVTFTGSVETGRTIYRTAADKLIPVTLELGGKSPMIVLPDADFDKAVAGAVVAMRFTRQGQSCTAASRILVHSSLHDRFVESLVEKISEMTIGDPLDEATDIGTIISEVQFDKVRGYIEAGRETAGAVAHEGAELPGDERLAEGFFVRPVVFTGIDNAHPVAREEIFGPVTCVMPFDTLDEALEIANDTPFGLAASVWTRDLKTALVAVNSLEAGYVQVNQALVAGVNISYGGYKQSGLGKELTLDSMLDHFTHSKSISLNFQ
ncbi:aldehyde dehydrogenase family protein [Streptomyces griseorubiginosus]|uniref:aldehyde dehydrogenase family protein n=1 Tax=Streptomyces griseorubiginosus TaxID=67304 RepID=UPI001AD7CC6C|nr:aldehyde dehydrogenase family protein [Streptomyces griseorubiginosus]MBO4252338.1 aldehyde dehydrogenase family protein [Streptomyces griseorubiginosus]